MSYTYNGIFTSDAVSALSFGVVGNGSTDDTDALNALFASNHKCIYIPTGVYRISKTLSIPQGKVVFGDGEGTVFQLAPTFSLTTLAWRDEAGHRTMCPLIHVHDNSICRDFKIIGDTTEAKDQFQIGLLANGENIVCHNISTENINYFPQAWREWVSQGSGYRAGYGPNNYCPGYGIFVFNASNVRIYGGSHKNCGYQAIGTDHATDVVVDGLYCGDTNAVGLQIHRGCRRVTFVNCIVNNQEVNHESSFTFHGSEDDGWCEDLSVINCILTGNPYAFGIQSVWGFEKNVIISGCKIESEKDGIYICRSSHAGVALGDAAKDFTITNNIIRAGASGDGIKVNGDYCVVTNNTVHCGGSVPINVSGTHKVIENNLVAGLL